MEKSKSKCTKRRRLNGQHRWTDAETQSFVQVVAEEVRGRPEYFEKPTAQQFYEKIASNAGLENFEWVPMKNKMRHLRASFVAAVNWKNQTTVGDEQKVADYINKICPKYYHLEQIFGQRKSVNPRVILETSNEVFDAEISDFDHFRSSTPELSSASERCSETNSLGFSALKATLRAKANTKTTTQTPTNSDLISFLISLQEKRLEIELKKFEIERNKAKAEIELKTMKQDHEFQIKKLQIESEERIRKYELELKSKRNEHSQMNGN